MKKLGIDLRGLQTGHEFRGIGMYIRSLVEEILILGADKNHQIIFYHYDTTDPVKLLQLPEGAEYKQVVFANPKKPYEGKSKMAKGRDYVREIIKNNFTWSPVPKTRGLDVFLQFDQHLGLPKSPFTKKLLVVHDLIPLVFARQYLPSAYKVWRNYDWKAAVKVAAANWRYRRGLRQIRRASKVLAISQHTRQDLIDMLGIKSKKIIVVPNGGSHRPADNPDDPKKQTRFAGSDEVSAIIDRAGRKPYLLFIGGPEPPRRRLDHLTTAYHHLRAAGHDLQLVFVGKELGSTKSIPSARTAEILEHLSYVDDLHLLGFVKDQDVNRLYQHALAFVFPSLYEGFGLPLLEAMQHGCPVIAYRNSSIPEVVGEAGLLIEPGYQEIVRAVETLLGDPGHKEEFQTAATGQLKKYTWAAAAKKTLETVDGF